MTGAAQHLRHAKGLDPMVTASQSGLPVDITKVRNIFSCAKKMTYKRAQSKYACAEHVVTGVTKCVTRVNMKCDRNRRREEGNGVKSKTPLCSSRSHLFRVCVSLVCAWVYLHIFSITPLFMFHMVTTYPIWLSFILPHFYWTSLLRVSRVFRCDSVPLWNYQEYYACASVGLSSCRSAEYHAGLETDI